MKCGFRLYPNDMTKMSHDGNKISNTGALIEKQKLHPQQQQQQQQQQQLLHQNIIIQGPSVSPTCIGVSRKRKSLCTT